MSYTRSDMYTRLQGNRCDTQAPGRSFRVPVLKRERESTGTAAAICTYRDRGLTLKFLSAVVFRNGDFRHGHVGRYQARNSPHGVLHRLGLKLRGELRCDRPQYQISIRPFASFVHSFLLSLLLHWRLAARRRLLACVAETFRRARNAS